MTRPVVFLDVDLGPEYVGRIKIELFADTLPKTSENFRQFCTGEHRVNGTPQGYKGAPFHRVIKGFMIQGGDFVKGNGTGTATIFGSTSFPDEGFQHSHDKYSVSMANSGPDTNGCQFFICCDRLPHLDGKHVVFGKVIEGTDVVDKIERVRTGDNDRPYPLSVTISNCGEM
uniref:Peptidyl-prolyl cis-trans isomerase n=1 Tax=Blastobotrys adeninivorans TaxID=409370 RepID=A0A060SWI0_BLAAD